MKECIQFIKNAYSEEKSYSHGVECEFIPFDNCWGIKAYYNKKKRDENYDWQIAANEYGLGPDVGSKFQFSYYDKDNKKVTKYCFITEAVEPLADNGRHDWYEDFLNELENKEIEFAEEIDNVCLELEDKIGFYMRDKHAANFGRRKSDGFLICIDFGND